MNRIATVASLAALGALVLSCQSCQSSPAPTAPPAALPDPMAALDTRTPVPMPPKLAWSQRQMMNDQLVAVQEILDGLERGDAGWPDVTRGAGRMVTTPKRDGGIAKLEVGSPAFAAMARAYNGQAADLAAAAARKDAPAVRAALATALRTCNGCHAAFRQEVVPEPAGGAP